MYSSIALIDNEHLSHFPNNYLKFLKEHCTKSKDKVSSS